MNGPEGLKPVPVGFACEKARLTWADAVWAHDRGWFGWRSLVELARIEDDANDGMDVLRRLRGSGKDDSHEVADLARRLAAMEGDTGDPAPKWLYIVLSWLYFKRDEILDYWTVIEEIYAEFDYPSTMRRFVRYEPVSPEDKAEWSSYPKPEDYLREQWRKYLADAEKRYSPSR